jgi:hypothetical protein
MMGEADGDEMKVKRIVMDIATQDIAARETLLPGCPRAGIVDGSRLPMSPRVCGDSTCAIHSASS